MALSSGINSGSEIIATMRDVTVTFDGYLTRALSRVDLDVRRGEVFGIVGAKGSGKSTMLRLLAGRSRPTEGVVKVFGRSPRRGSTKARVGYVPGTADADLPTGFVRRLFGRKKEAQAAARGGAGLTQAIMGSRDLVILDEPFAEMSPAEKSELKKLIRELAGSGKTVVITSETLVDAKDVADRLLIVHEGRIQAIGSLQKLLNAPNAIRYLAFVVPPEVDQQIAKILQREITVTAKPSSISSKVAESPVPEKPREALSPDEHLAELTQGAESSAPGAVSKPNQENSIDHDKLEGLTKPGKPE
jgi:ABC-2 type transport system ATP-binding protein